MNILVTGGTGMVGRNFIEYLSNMDCNILHPTHKELDLLIPSLVNKYFDDHNIDIVVHCAGIVGGIYINMKRKDVFLSDNIIMGLNLINIAKTHGIKKLINLGSSCMYPVEVKIPLKEDSLCTGRCESTNEGYAIAKNAVAKMCEFVSEDGFEYKTIIPCNLYGRWDNFNSASSHLMAAIIDKLYKAKENNDDIVEIWGDGKSKREFLYAGDLADFLWYSINNFEKIPRYINVGTGHDFTINQYYDIAAKIIGYKGKFVHDLFKPIGIKRKVMDISRIKHIKWKSMTSLEEGISKAYKFYMEQIRI